ncbi:uncharacterized protein LOC124675348 [Lolium rigidum]|uniref:uncharacterized protein LOC124675348 n=1 Tax=Lolium rigidum TaxID=89674 RepID=UPI001F5E2254|nr:uncharacterized protein LOC124675348 [Lolium rigidum]XP_047067377.1 uncharacterized protein LOC124675348 [Lolium rigidum]
MEQKLMLFTQEHKLHLLKVIRVLLTTYNSSALPLRFTRPARMSSCVRWRSWYFCEISTTSKKLVYMPAVDDCLLMLSNEAVQLDGDHHRSSHLPSWQCPSKGCFQDAEKLFRICNSDMIGHLQ